MRGVISLTDLDWFQFLRAQPALDEVNFWRPSDTNRPHLAPGTPFIFKLSQKHGGWIVGFGIFASHSVLPMWMAWDAFERTNGAETFAGFHALLAAVRGRKDLPADPAGTYEIGCVMLSAPEFFEREDWILPPTDWPQSGIMQGKSYDLSVGEGARVWENCQAVARGRGLLTGTPERASEPAGPRYGEPALVRPRLGQGTFRIAVTDAYGRSCAVTTEHSLPVLEAAHIRPYAQDGPHEVSNGLLLRTDLHRLFDKGYVTVTPEHRFLVSRRLKDEYQNGRTYYAMHDTPIHLPRDPRDYPDPAKLEWHARELFRDSA
jgi:putative restriction endonuclease